MAISCAKQGASKRPDSGLINKPTRAGDCVYTYEYMCYKVC